MGKAIQARVDGSLIDVFGIIGKSFADKIKKEYNLDELFVSHALTSQILAAHYKGKRIFNFKVKKTGLRTGTLSLED